MLGLSLELPAYYLSEGFKACLDSLWSCQLTTLAKDSGHAWTLSLELPAYYLSEGFKACLDSLWSCWLTTLAKDSRHAWTLFGAAGLLP